MLLNYVNHIMTQNLLKVKKSLRHQFFDERLNGLKMILLVKKLEERNKHAQNHPTTKGAERCNKKGLFFHSTILKKTTTTTPPDQQQYVSQ